MAFSIHTLCFHEDQLCSLTMINGLVYWDAVIYFCLFHTFIVDKNNEIKTTYFIQQKLRKYNQQGYKIPPAWQKLEMKKLLYGYFYNHKRQFQVVCYVFFAIMLCPYNNMDWTLMEWGYFLINCYCFHYLHCQSILPFDSFRVSCLKNDNNVYIMQIIW